MLAIRMQRVGRKKQPLYRVVVSEKTKDTYGNHLEILGQYNPHTKEANLKEERVKHWLAVGAQASESLHNLLVNKGLIKADKQKAVKISNKRKAKQAKAQANSKAKEAKADTESPEAQAETPVEEKPKGKAEESKEEAKAEEASTDTQADKKTAEEKKP